MEAVNLTEYESRYKTRYGIGNNLSLAEVADISKKRSESNSNEPNFMPEYLPSMRYESPTAISSIFICTIEKHIETGSYKYTRYILFDKNGNPYDELPILTQLLPGSSLAKISCRSNALSAQSLELEYFINTDNVSIEYGNALFFNNAEINVDENGNYYSKLSNGNRIIVNPMITNFEDKKEEIFYNYFKYVF